MVIYANHALRASVAAMQKVFARILSDGGAQNVSNEIALVAEIFRLQRMERVTDIEERFLR